MISYLDPVLVRIPQPLLAFSALYLSNRLFGDRSKWPKAEKQFLFSSSKKRKHSRQILTLHSSQNLKNISVELKSLSNGLKSYPHNITSMIDDVSQIEEDIVEYLPLEESSGLQFILKKVKKTSLLLYKGRAYKVTKLSGSRKKRIPDAQGTPPLLRSFLIRSNILKWPRLD